MERASRREAPEPTRPHDSEPSTTAPSARLRRMVAAMREDLDVVVDRDPSIGGRGEALLHPSIAALWSHRCARVLYLSGRRTWARAVMVAGRLASGIELHPGARIGRRFFVDHGAATVVGETCVIGDDVTLFHQVTLGAVGYWKDRDRPEGEARHPRLGNRVVVGANATVLGPVVIADGATVGAHSMVVTDVDPGGRVRAPGSPLHRKPSLVVHPPTGPGKTQPRGARPAPKALRPEGARALVSPEGGWVW